MDIADLPVELDSSSLDATSLASMRDNDIYDRIEAENEGINQKEVAEDWEYDSTQVFTGDLYGPSRMKALTTLRTIKSFSVENLIAQFRVNQARYLPPELATSIEHSITGDIHLT